MFKYRIFGLNVCSDIELDCYKFDFDDLDVLLIEEDLGKIYDIQKFIRIDRDHAVLNMAGIAKFEITNGNKIAYHKDISSSHDELILYLMGTVFGTLMMQREDFPLHGSVVNKGQQCVAILGDSGAGKSSLAAGLAFNGWKILTDDVVRLVESTGGFDVHCSYPSSKLWSQTTKGLGIDVSTFNSVIKREDKYYYKNDDMFYFGSSTLDIVLELVAGDVGQVSIEKLNYKDTLELLIRNSYRYFVLEFSGQIPEHFKYMINLCSKVSGYRIIRPQNQFSVKEQVELINNLLGETNEKICV